jgi:putative endonuclease
MRPRDGTEHFLMEWFVYVLLNDAQIAYTGIAKDVVARLGQHNAGKGARFTRGRGPWRIVHVEGPMAHGDALRREIGIKVDAVFKRKLKQAADPSERTAPPLTPRLPSSPWQRFLLQ